MKPHLESADMPQDDLPMEPLDSRSKYLFRSHSSPNAGLPLYKRLLLCIGLDCLAGRGMRLPVSSNDEVALLTEDSENE